MGVVWLAERADAGNLVAIKFLPHAGLSPSRRERFAREIKTLAKLKHPFIARLYDAGTLPDGTPWFVMEYVQGLRFKDEEAEGIFKDVLRIQERAFGGANERLAATLEGLGVIRSKRGDLAGAEAVLSRDCDR